jgi:hypothetical protein
MHSLCAAMYMMPPTTTGVACEWVVPGIGNIHFGASRARFALSICVIVV